MTAGQSITLYLGEYAPGGALGPAAANTVYVRVYYENDTSTPIIAWTFSSPNWTDYSTNPHTVTFYATSDGTSTGTPKAGTVRLYIRAVNTGTGTSYDVNSDASGIYNYQGYLRSNIPLVTGYSVSNVTYGGASPSLFAYPDTMYIQVNFSVGRWTQTTNNEAFLLNLNFVTQFLTTNVGSNTYVQGSQVLTNQFSKGPLTINLVSNQNSPLSGVPWTTFVGVASGSGLTYSAATVVYFSIQTDPLLYFAASSPYSPIYQAKAPQNNSSGLPDSTNDPEASVFYIGADVMYTRAHVQNGRGENVTASTVNVDMQLWNLTTGASIQSHTADTLDSNGWTGGTSHAWQSWNVNPPPGQYVLIARAYDTGTRANESMPSSVYTSPLVASGSTYAVSSSVPTGAQQLINFAASYTANQHMETWCEPYVRPGEPIHFYARCLRTNLAGAWDNEYKPDQAPQVVVYSMQNGAWTNVLPATTMTLVSGSTAQYTYTLSTPLSAGTYTALFYTRVAGADIYSSREFRVVPYVIDPVGLAISGVLVKR
jgi:hypothetical protein